jgi:hypothetical protein
VFLGNYWQKCKKYGFRKFMTCLYLGKYENYATDFNSRTEAVAFRQEKDVEYLNQEFEGQTVWTTLPHEQNRDVW